MSSTNEISNIVEVITETSELIGAVAGTIEAVAEMVEAIVTVTNNKISNEIDITTKENIKEITNVNKQ